MESAKRKRMEEVDEGELMKRAEAMKLDDSQSSRSVKTLRLLHRFLAVQQRRAETYAKLRRKQGLNYAVVPISLEGIFRIYEQWGGGGLAYKQLCEEITGEFNDFSKQVIELGSLFVMPNIGREDLAELLKVVQAQEKLKLQFTAEIHILKKVGRLSERPVSHEYCQCIKPSQHFSGHVHELTEAVGTEDAEADAEYDGALKEVIQGIQDAVTTINEHLEEVKYEIDALESEQC